MIHRNVDSLVTLYAVESSKKFIVHKDYACHYSPVFKAAFASQFLEGQTQEYRLEDTTEEVLRILVQWLYTQELDSPPIWKEDKELSESEKADGKQYHVSLVRLWILADSLLMSRLQNIVMRDYQERT